MWSLDWKNKTINPRLEADKRLLNFKDYDHYLDSFITEQDKCNIKNIKATQLFASLGYKSNGEVLSKELFKKRIKQVMEYVHPGFIPYIMASEGIECPDVIHRELAIRERFNRVGILSTIIYIRVINKYGYEISGYIDYINLLRTKNLKGFFKGEDIIYPTSKDLGFYHWKTGATYTNDSFNYKTRIAENGLIFQNRYDRLYISVNPNTEPGHNTKRLHINSKIYEQVTLFDHFVRQRI